MSESTFTGTFLRQVGRSAVNLAVSIGSHAAVDWHGAKGRINNLLAGFSKAGLTFAVLTVAIIVTVVSGIGYGFGPILGWVFYELGASIGIPINTEGIVTVPGVLLAVGNILFAVFVVVFLFGKVLPAGKKAIDGHHSQTAEVPHE